MKGTEPDAAEAARPRKTLVVVIHGLGGSPHRMREVIGAVRAAYDPDTVVYAPSLPHGRWLSGFRAWSILKTLLDGIDAEVDRHRPDRIVLVGHSVGATLARRLFLVAVGRPKHFVPEEALLDEPPRAWAPKVERIVMLAAFNRGWKISQRMGWLSSILFNIVGLLGHLVPTKAGWTPTAFDFRLGAPFMAQTRLNWLAYRRAAPEGIPDPNRPILIQLLGTQDDLVAPIDQIDLAVDGTGQAFLETGAPAPAPGPEEQDYFLISLPQTNHEQAIVLRGDAAAQERGRLFWHALADERTALAAIASDPALLVDEIEAVDFDVKNTVFVIHGIRDDGFWTHRIAEKVRERGEKVRGSITTFRSWTPTYGYFAMLPFVLLWIRREKVEWFADQYVTAFAQYPKSDFHYVGHSNGTYLAARALQDYPAIHFQRVLFAGSVVRRDYPWTEMVRQKRVTAFQNVVAAGDWVVALLPKSVDWIPYLDLGGAGFDGFDDAGALPAITEFKYLHGGHSAGIGEVHWDRIAAFIVDGTPFPPDPAAPVRGLYETEPDPTWKVFGDLRIGLPAVILIGLLVFWLGYTLGGLFGLLLAVLLIRFVVTRL